MNLFDKLFGCVRFELWGDCPEEFLNVAAEEGIELWKIKREKDCLYAETRIWQEEDVKKAAKKCRLVYTEKESFGPLKTAKRYRLRFGLLTGAILLCTLVFLSSLFLWKVDVVGCEKTDETALREKLSEYGIKVGGFSKRDDIKDVQLLILRDFPEIAFVAVNVKGSFATVEVSEREMPPETVDQYPPCNVVASDPGEIISVKVYSGVTLCKKGDVVSKGQLLVSGVFDSKYVGFRLVHAKAEIEARTEKKVTATKTYVYEKEELTGNTQTVYTLNLFGFEFSFPKRTFENAEEDNDVKYLKINDNFYLPVSFSKTVCRETKKVTATRTPEETEKAALAEVDEKLRIFTELNRTEEIYTDVIRDGKGVTVNCYCTVISDIAAEKEIFRN